MRVPTTPTRLLGWPVAVLGIAFASGLGLQGYVTNGHAWASRSVPYLVNPANADVAESEAEAAIRQGADAWGSQSHASFTFTYGGRTTGTTLGYNGKNESFFRNTSNGSVIAETLWTYDGTGALVDADVVFYDGGWRFFTGTSGCTGGFYVEDVATHEFGHALGLGHSGEGAATMYPTASSCTVEMRTLHADDVAGVEALYAVTAVQAPAAPSNLSASASATTPASAVSLRWSDNSTNEDAFLVERTTGNASYLQVATLGPNVTAYTDQNLSASTMYSYRVRASNTSGFSGYTNVASAAPSAPPTSVPATPVAVSPANASTGVSVDADLAWSSAGAQQYDVYFGTSAAPPAYSSNQASASLALPRLAAGTTYYWKVVARNSAGSTEGGVWMFTTKAARKKR
jgi:hypothetical protein